MDDGGLDLERSSLWIREGIARAAAITAGAQNSAEWSRESWGANITPNLTTVFSLHDEALTETVSTKSFVLALSNWLKFMEAGIGLPLVEVNLI